MERLRPRLRVGAVLALALAAGLVTWIVTAHDDQGASTESTAALVSARGLRTLAGVLGTPVYWVGPRRGVRYELTQTPDGRVYVRYLPEGVEAGSSEPYLTVGTYPVEDAFAATARAATEGTVSIPLPGGVAFFAPSRPTNVYAAFRGVGVQIEVFAPSGETAQALVRAGKLRPVAARPSGGPAPTSAVAASRDELEAVAAELGRPIYWAGEREGATYELTRSPGDRVYVRYLPAGVPVGTKAPYLTVATYPLEHGFEATRRAASQPGSVRVPAGPGAVAFYARTRPTNVYLAFRGIDEQIEIFDPSPQRARELVVSQQIRPVG